MHTDDPRAYGLAEYVHENRIDFKFIAGLLFLEFFAFAISTGAIRSMVAEGSLDSFWGVSIGLMIGVTPAMRISHRAGRSTGQAVYRTTTGSSVRYKHGVLRLCLVLAVLAGTGIMWLGLQDGIGGGTVVGVVFTVPFVVLSVGLIRGGRRRPRIQLTSEGVIQEGYGFRKTIPWDSMTDAVLQPKWPPEIGLLAPIPDSFEYVKLTRLKLDEQPNHFPGAFIDCRFFDVHPVVLTRWIRLYLENPKLRHELGTDAATDRLANLLP
ncbi:YjbE family integral membrane protein [Rhodococcus sp. AW25M09]|uniref:hypothetical protein n=1 Tax=Rhodococcus sp. AW25M09 TaxID=1268303 RepID=UPI0002AC821C|nr:hypothetical protein [Rhodococcus sp. AW25M09]CCQ15698.1 YjbE family integral membrane protein [Rhodococcus sp. AW25M09]